MIKLVRVDHRLIHGQVAFTWTKFLSTDCILIASDGLLKDDLRMAGLRMAKPSNVKLVMKSIEDSAKALNSGVTDKYNLLILCESVEDVYRLAKKVPSITAINLGGTKSADDRKNISKAVNVSQDDIKMIKELSEEGRSVFVQLVPDDDSTDVMKLI
ncbi:MAG TPA: PTS mannose/fructose/sorbose transporter subunit IIB [Terrisporobacter glycolicus]|uniref:PTS sugar transporter subunit IIB n=1 Tax=Terrisporobacter TaxID=1505652 RepID=UPI000E9371C9|nr:MULTISPECIES: PTS sugar transporter subunit IIB [Terrisporobacter]MBN9646923.1 PTS sugar transporter subunit IIB [Terrisporobacter glycolicus]HBI91622.1 PTS mannose/fructose/sorbose transporter subunit IIB [Terrisporobacter hibernicus]